jgi:hypothetical protein
MWGKEENQKKKYQVVGEMAILWRHEFFGILLAAQNYGNVPERASATEISLTDPNEIEMGNSEQLEERKYNSWPENRRRVE